MKRAVAVSLPLALVAACGAPGGAPAVRSETAGAGASEPASGAEPVEPPEPAEPAAPAAVSEREPATERRLGVLVRTYHVYGEPDERALLAPYQAPNEVAVAAGVDLDASRGDFGGVGAAWIARLDALLEVPASGTYGLRAAAGQRTRIYVDGELALLGSQECALELAAGEHALSVEHFGDVGAPLVRVEWKPPGAAEFQSVPPHAWTRPRELPSTARGTKNWLPRPTPVAPAESGAQNVLAPGLLLRDVLRFDALDSPALARAGADGSLAGPRVSLDRGGLARASDGRLLVLSDPGTLWSYDDGARQPPRRIADGFDRPAGVAVLGTRVFVLQRSELTEVVDLDGDGVCDEYRCVDASWNVERPERLEGAALAASGGRLYVALAGADDAPSAVGDAPAHGRLVRVEPDGGATTIASGLRAPRGLALDLDGRLWLSDERGTDLREPRPILCCLGAEPQPGLRVEPTVVPWSDAQRTLLGLSAAPAWWSAGELRGQALAGGARTFGLARVFVDEFEGVVQGASFALADNLGLRTSRALAEADGSVLLYGAPLHAAGSAWPLVRRLESCPASGFEMRAVRALPGGFEIELSDALAEGVGEQPELYTVEQRPLAGLEPAVALVVRSAEVSADRRRIVLALEGLEAERLVRIVVASALATQRGTRLWSSEALYTLRRLPRERRRTENGARALEPASATATHATGAGWESLFDGASLAAWSERTGTWSVTGGELLARASATLASAEVFDDFELEFEWRVGRGGAGGVSFRSGDGDARAPRYALIDDERCLDARNPLRTTGANSDLHEPSLAAALPAGALNRSRIVARGGHVEHWLNGFKVVEYETGGPDWSRRDASGRAAGCAGASALRRGRIVLACERGELAFRSVRVRSLAP